MPQVRYGGKKGPKVDLEQDDDLLVVRTRSRRSYREGPVAPPGAALLTEMESILQFPDAGVEVFRKRESATRKMDVVRSELKKAPDTRFAGRVLVDKTSGEPVVYTENFFIKFQDRCARDRCLAILREYGLTIKDEVPYAANAWFVSAPEGTGQQVFDIAEELLGLEEVEYCHPELVRKLGRRAIFDTQWHLKPTVVHGQNVNAHAHVETAHALTQGEGITIAVIDTGIDIDHEEFSSPGKIVAPRDTTSRDDNPRPESGENHGTACAGVACADGRFGASGVAPKARLMPIRMVSGLGSQGEANAFFWAASNGADVISCSWGPADGDWFAPNDPLHSQIVPIPDSTRLAIEFAATQGRGGKGCVILFAAGNGNENVNNDGYASYEKVIAVAACNDRNRRSVYSDFGNAVYCSFPSNDFEFGSRPAPLTPGIWTTDRMGLSGYNRRNTQDGDALGNYTNSFGGTSSACPGAAGVAALVLARNPNLTREQVKDILRQSCDRIDPQGGEYDSSGRSRFYGFGRLNAETAVRLALPAEGLDALVISRTYSKPIRDMRTSKVTLDVGESLPIKDLKIIVDIRHTYIGDLLVTVIPPEAMNADSVVLHNRTGGTTDDLRRTYDAPSIPDLAEYQGKSPFGRWTLEVRDEGFADVGTILRFGLELVLEASRDSVGPSSHRGARTKQMPQRAAGKQGKGGKVALGAM